MELLYLLTVAGIVAMDPSKLKTYINNGKTQSELKELRDNVGLLQEVLVELNHEGMCLYPAAFMEGSVFLNQFFEDNDVQQDFSEHIKWEN